MKPGLGLVLVAVLGASPAAAQRHTEQFYYPGAFNWSFLRNFPEAARLFNAFDYGHAVLYERLYVDPAGAAARLEREFRFLTTDLLVRPPRFAVAEEAIMPGYGRLAWRAKAMFDWAHVLHRQIYDVYADSRIPSVEKPRLVERLTDYYLANGALAFTSVPKTMELMDEQAFSRVFRRAHPRFNGLIWAYHWLQVGLYDALMAGTTPAQRQANVTATVARFWQMLQSAPATLPSVMPMTAAVAPRFAGRYPEAAIIFDNLHGLHDVIADVLASPAVPRERKRPAILLAAARYRDDTSFVTTVAEWRDMARAMGVANMGGPIERSR